MPVPRGADGFHHPASEDEIVELIRDARAHGRRVRARGSGHTFPARAIHTERFPKAQDDEVNVLLDRWRGVRLDESGRTAAVRAGTHLGIDPQDPTSTWANVVLLPLDRKGWALSHLGGISHQTVAGFLSTGSNGGSLTRSAYDNVVGVRLVDGTGKVHELQRDRDERFFGAVVSMGLWGMITEVTFRCEDRYDILGQEAITTVADCACDLFSAGPKGVSEYLTRKEYGRMMWWPQADRITAWEARRMRREDYTPEVAPKGVFTPKVYSELGSHPELNATLAGAAYDLLGKWVDDPSAYKTLAAVLPPLVGAFVPLDKGRPPQRFWDSWYHGLPMDNGVSDEKVPIEFSEIWVPLDRADEALRLLRDHFKGGIGATGILSSEIYGAKRTDFWMHASYGEDRMRIDFLWFSRADGDPAKVFYPQYWELLKEMPFRVHWGKHVPSPDTPWNGWKADRSVGSWTEYLRRQYPRWDDFLAVRKELDPDGVFLTRYWRRRLGIA